MKEAVLLPALSSFPCWHKTLSVVNMGGGRDQGEKRQGKMSDFHLDLLHSQAASVVE